MREIGVTLGKCDGEFGGRVHVSKHQVGESLGASASGIPGFEDARDFVGPWHSDGASRFGNQISSCQCVWPLPGGIMALPPMGSTWAEPPPEIIPTSECAPMTAIERSLEASRGRMAESFLRRTMLPSSIFCETSRPPTTSGT